MKYKIEITGRGVDCYVHKITEFQKNDLIDNEIEMNDDSIDDVANILSIDDVFELYKTQIGDVTLDFRFKKHNDSLWYI